MFFLKTWPKIFITPLTLFPLFSLRPPKQNSRITALSTQKSKEGKKRKRKLHYLETQLI